MSIFTMCASPLSTARSNGDGLEREGPSEDELVARAPCFRSKLIISQLPDRTA